MKNPQYKDPIAALLIERFEELCLPDMKGKFMHGTPFTIAQNQMNFPTVCVSGNVESSTGMGSNEQDESRMLYRVTVMIDVKKDWLVGKSIVGPEMELHKMLVGRDENMDMLPGSIEWMLRKNHVLSGEKRLYIDLGRETRAYIRPSIEARGRGMFLYEGIVEFEIRHNQIRPQFQQP